MDEKRKPLVEEETKYKKKSKNKGLPRSKHKHTYETVLLYRYSHFINVITGKEDVSESVVPTKICSICNRIDDVDLSYYRYETVNDFMFVFKKRELKEKAFDLPKYYVNDYFDKFAIKKE
jgi:hypothetical protein